MSYEAVVIKKLLEGEVLLIQELSPPMFTKRVGKIYELILIYFGKHNKLPTAELLKAEIELRAPTSIRETFKAKVDAIMLASSTIDTMLAVESLREAAILREVDERIDDIIDAQRDKDAKTVKELIGEVYESLSVSSVHVKDYAEAFDEDDGFTVVPSGLGESFDELIGGGFTGLTLLGALSGGLKSVWLQNSAVASLEADKKVLFLSLELSGRVLGNRVKSQLSGVPFSRINTGKLSPGDNGLITTAEKKLDGKTFRIITDPIDTDGLVNIITVEHQVHGVDVFYIDYINLVSPSAKESGESWKVLSTIVKRLHRLTMQLGVTIVTATQVNIQKRASEAEPPELTTRGSQELLFSASQFFFLHQLEDAVDGEEDFRVAFTMKNRIAAARHVLVRANPSIMTLEATDTLV